MYNDEKNLYHYTYRKDGSETADGRSESAQGAAGTENASGSVDDQINGFRTARQQPPVDMKPAKKVHATPFGKKAVALALCCALLGGLVGGGAVYAMNGGGKSAATDVQLSGRTAKAVTVKTVDGKTEMSDAEIYASTVNSVVSINVTGTSGTNIFGQSVQTASAGSGFVLTEDGYIVTNYHVIDGANSVKVTLYNGDSYDAGIVGGDEDYDIAVLKIDATGLQAVTLGKSDELNVGDRVLAIGNPLGELTFSMSGGMVSCVNRAINVNGTPFNMIQTDASINPGNSGGPLMNSYGEVVGIVSAKYSSYSNESVEGLGFAIPINDVLAMIQDIMTNGYVTNKPYLGITGGTMTQGMAAQYRYSISEGVFVYSVEENGAAAKAGLKMGDVITKVDDTTIASMEDLTAVKKKYSAGDTSTLTIYREGKTTSVELTWGTVPKTDTTQAQQSSDQENNSQQGGTTNPYDLFEYFFNQGGQGGSRGNAAG